MLGFWDGLRLWLSPGHLLLSGDGLGTYSKGHGFGLWFWSEGHEKEKSRDCALANAIYF